MPRNKKPQHNNNNNDNANITANYITLEKGNASQIIFNDGETLQDKMDKLATKDYVRDMINNAKMSENEKVDLSEYATKDYVRDMINNAKMSENEKVDLSEYVTKDELEEVEEMLDGKSFRYVSQAYYNALSDAEKNNNSVVWCITDSQK